MKRPRATALEEVQRWVGFALARGDQEFGINLDGGWAGFRQLACAAANDRRDFRDVTSESLKLLLQEDHSGRWEINGDKVRKVPRSERGQRLCEKPAVPRRPQAIVKPSLRPQQPSMPPPAHLVRSPQQPSTTPPAHLLRSPQQPSKPPASPLQTRPKPSMAPELQIESYLSPNDNREKVFLRLG